MIVRVVRCWPGSRRRLVIKPSPTSPGTSRCGRCDMGRRIWIPSRSLPGLGLIADLQRYLRMRRM